MLVTDANRTIHDHNLLQTLPSKTFNLYNKIPIDIFINAFYDALYGDERIVSDLSNNRFHRAAKLVKHLNIDTRHHNHLDLWKIDNIEYPPGHHFAWRISDKENGIEQKDLPKAIETMLQNTRSPFSLSLFDTFRRFSPFQSKAPVDSYAKIANTVMLLATRYHDIPIMRAICEDVEEETNEEHSISSVGPRQIEITRPTIWNDHIKLVISAYALVTPSTTQNKTTTEKQKPPYKIINNQATASEGSSWYHFTRSFDFDLKKNEVTELTDIVHKQVIVTKEDGARESQWLNVDIQS